MFSFYFGSHDQSVTGNDYDIEFYGTTIGTNQVVDNIGTIVDLGNISCKDVPNSYEQTGAYPGKGHGGYPYKEDRTLDPMFWFEYSSAMEKLTRGLVSSDIQVQEGHCYAVNKITNNRRILALFHVKKLELNKSVSIDEIELIKRQELRDKSN